MDWATIWSWATGRQQIVSWGLLHAYTEGGRGGKGEGEERGKKEWKVKRGKDVFLM